MPHAIQMHQTGGPGVLNWTAVDVGEPGTGQVRLRQAAAGLNYIDVYHRTGYYPQPLPLSRAWKVPGPYQAAAMMLQGMTAQVLIRQVYPVKAGDLILVHAAAGRTGLILCQWAAALGHCARAAVAEGFAVSDAPVSLPLH